MNKYTKALEFNPDKHEYRVNGVVLPSVTELCGPLTYSKYRVDNAVVEQAAYRGTIVHEITALWDRGDLEDESTLAADVGMYLMGWIKFCHDYSPEWQYIELPLACRTFAGTLDRVGWIDGRLVVVDIKTTASMDRANKIALSMQLFGYWDLCINNDIDSNYLYSFGVQLKKDGTYSVIEADKVNTKYGILPCELWDLLISLNTLTKGDRSIE